MFPLGTVLLPGMGLPLHVFEPRYRELMERCLGGDRRFGVTLISRGSEVGGGDVRTSVGTVAEIVQASQAPDGRWAVMTVGTGRIRVETWLDDDPYPRAVVEEWPDPVADDPATLAEHYRQRVAQLRRMLAMVVELGQSAEPMVEVSDDPIEGQWQLAILAPLATLDRQRVLSAPGPDERMALLGDLFDDLEAELQGRLGLGSPPFA